MFEALKKTWHETALDVSQTWGTKLADFANHNSIEGGEMLVCDPVLGGSKVSVLCYTWRRPKVPKKGWVAKKGLTKKQWYAIELDVSRMQEKGLVDFANHNKVEEGGMIVREQRVGESKVSVLCYTRSVPVDL